MQDWEAKVKAAYMEYEHEVTYIASYRHKDLYIVHGEITIYCFDLNLQKCWGFSGRDIWITIDDSPALTLCDSCIKLKDWLGYEYVLDYNGKKIKG